MCRIARWTAALKNGHHRTVGCQLDFGMQPGLLSCESLPFFILSLGYGLLYDLCLLDAVSMSNGRRVSGRQPRARMVIIGATRRCGALWLGLIRDLPLYYPRDIVVVVEGAVLITPVGCPPCRKRAGGCCGCCGKRLCLLLLVALG